MQTTMTSTRGVEALPAAAGTVDRPCNSVIPRDMQASAVTRICITVRFVVQVHPAAVLLPTSPPATAQQPTFSARVRGLLRRFLTICTFRHGQKLTIVPRRCTVSITRPHKAICNYSSQSMLAHRNDLGCLVPLQCCCVPAGAAPWPRSGH